MNNKEITSSIRDEKEILQERERELMDQIVPINRAIRKLKEQLDPLEREYSRLKQEFMVIDRDLAMLDGRFQKLEVVKGGGKKRAQQTAELGTEAIISKLTPEQIAAITAKIGG
jgi:predicted  nucleic acid-binding Zn-ribbon protein